MPRIRLLPENVVNKIAAGEVIQRPASVVKELLENAVDAEATQISVSVENGGISLIVCEDNGVGMDERDLPLAIQRHATSKIYDIVDMERVRSYGFRGEALAAISSVSKLEIISRTRDLLRGMRLYAEGGKIITLEPVATKPGTIVIVKDLFFNVPARKKFLKSESYETGRIIEEWVRVAIPNYQIGMTLTVDGKQKYVLHGCRSAGERISGIFGRMFFATLIPVEHSAPNLKIRGYISVPEATRKSKPIQYMFVNGRYFQDISIHNYIYRGYGSLLGDNHHPSFILFFEVPPEHVDVNVHPQKLEVALKDKTLICHITEYAIKYALGRIPTIDFRYAEMDQAIRKINIESAVGGMVTITSSAPPQQTQYLILQHEEKKSAHDVRIIHQLFDKYILAEVDGKMILVDQHQAHIRIIYEKYLFYIASKKEIPKKEELCVVSMSGSHLARILSMKEALMNFGFDIEQFGKDALAIHSYPDVGDASPSQEIISRLVELLGDDNPGKISPDDLVLHLAIAQSTPYGKSLSHHEMKYLVEELLTTSAPEISPTGKKIIHVLSSEDIDAFFKVRSHMR